MKYTNNVKLHSSGYHELSAQYISDRDNHCSSFETQSQQLIELDCRTSSKTHMADIGLAQSDARGHQQRCIVKHVFELRVRTARATHKTCNDALAT
jgi:hypothetical protein